MQQTGPDSTRADREIARYGVLENAPQRDLQTLVDLIAAICEVPHAAINVITSDRQHQIATAGIEPSVCTREDSMCAVVLEEQGTVVVPDASADDRFSGNPFVTGEIGAVRFYASAPIVTSERVTIGRLCVFDEVPRELSRLQREALDVMALQIMDVLELRFRSRALEESLQELTEVRDELHRTNEHLTLFAGQVSHDLRTPLTAILANAELLASEPTVEAAPEVLEMVSAVERAGHRMDAMIEEMLTFARQGGRLRIVETDLGRIAEQVLADVVALARRDDADIRIGALPVVMADPDLLYSVMLNLVTNAIKFARPGVQPVVSITAERLAEHWRIRVTDNGIGIARERQDAMFDLFARADEHVAGHGIGLATAKRIVESHGGTIGMDSPDGGGTSVWFDLPA
jgi:signal transduction histidine kinase